ncbi:MAG: hypothetical protein AVDCRST_MAG42-935 [uncultured Chthoniobacterales bacterium]|uniref:Uncharacterized protein n=1 Tax=uncultured Chthoniobacterales bacterium TaxID=1836801 RepID=A0A6J4HM58_9BACT|nr:MAG: hypothetical protein AVDCRST_MAG42-935 [uncultured Chthoniobacterales bacterium]
MAIEALTPPVILSRVDGEGPPAVALKVSQPKDLSCGSTRSGLHRAFREREVLRRLRGSG